jgi:hypothetical protein
MLRNRDRVASVGGVTAGGVSPPAVEHRAVDQTFIGMFGCTTGLPARMQTIDYDNVWGSVTCDPAPSAWQAIGARLQGAEVEGVVARINR